MYKLKNALYDKNRTLLSQPNLPLFLALLAMILTLPVLWLGLQADDLAHRAVLLGQLPGHSKGNLSPFGMFFWIDGNPLQNMQLMDYGIPWWTFEKLRIVFWRPLAELTHWIDYQLWPDLPPLMYLQNILWFGAVGWAVSILFRRIMGPSSVAGLAALLYAVSRTHADSLNMIACRSSLIATFFGVLTIISLDRKIKDSWRAGTVVGPICLMMALLSAEYGIVTAAYLLAYSIFLDHRSQKQRFFTMLPYITVLAIWMVVYKISGFGTYGSGYYTDPIREPLVFLSVVVGRLPILFTGQWTTLPVGIVTIVPQSVSYTIWVGSVVFMTMMGIVLIPLIRTDASARFWASGFALAIIPMCASLPNERLLIFTGLGCFGLLAQFLNGIYARADWLPNSLMGKVSVKVLFTVFVLIHLVISPLTLSFSTLDMARFSDRQVKRPAFALPTDSGFTRQNLVLINPPIVLMAGYIRWMRLAEGLPLPARTWILSSASSGMSVHRKDDRTLEIEPYDGFISMKLDELYRGSSFPMKVGQQMKLTGMTVIVLSLAEDGRPRRVSFGFSVPLEDSSLNFLEWHSNQYIRFTPPKIGETAYLAAASFF